MHTKICKNCGKEFSDHGKRGSQKFCSIECREENYRPKKDVNQSRRYEALPLTESTCRHCGETFTYKKVGKAKMYCRPTCRIAYYVANRDKKLAAKRQANFRIQNPEKSMLYRVRNHAISAGRACTITEKWIKEKLDSGYCEITGLPYSVTPYQAGKSGHRSFFTPSIDRIDNNKGYTPENVRMCIWGYNLAKNSFSDRDVTALALSLVLQAFPQVQSRKILEQVPPALLATLPANHRFV